MSVDIPSILAEHFAIAKFTITSLEGYESVNYKVTTSSKTFVLKVYTSDVETRHSLQAENKILHALNKMEEYQFPEVIRAKGGDEIVESKGKLYRLLSYIEGELLATCKIDTPLLCNFGRFLGEMNLSLQELKNPTIKGIETVWDLRHFAKSKDLISYIPNAKDRSLVRYFFLQYEENIRPVYYTLRSSIIHNDANDYNVLVQSNCIKGIIDFGDMCFTWLINELAIALTYVMMHSNSPLEVAYSVVSSYNKKIPLERKELQILYYLIAARLCTSVCNSAYNKHKKQDDSYITISEKGAWNLLKKWLTINPLKAEEVFLEACGVTGKIHDTKGRVALDRKKYLAKNLSLSYTKPIEMYRSAFQYMYSKQGETYLDAYNNIMLVGHSHPDVVAAAAQTYARLNTNTRYLYPELTEYSKKLLAKFDPKLNRIFFVNSGSAATDLAIRIAKYYTKRNKIVGLEHGYHGNTALGISISHYKYLKDPFLSSTTDTIALPLPGTIVEQEIPQSDIGPYYAKKAIATLESDRGDMAAFIAEPIVGCGGQVPLPEGYLKNLYPFIRQAGGICISDEVQVGFGRLGSSFWGYEQYDVVPDMVILGKPIGNGHPIGAVVTTTEVAEAFENGPEFFSSFGGNPISCAVGIAVLETIEKEGLQEHAHDVGCFLKNELQALQTKIPEIADVRGLGLFLGIEICHKDGRPNTDLANNLKNGLKKNYILTSTDGPYDNVIKIKPPLSFTKANAQVLVDTLYDLLRSLTKG